MMKQCNSITNNHVKDVEGCKSASIFRQVHGNDATVSCDGIMLCKYLFSVIVWPLLGLGSYY